VRGSLARQLASRERQIDQLASERSEARTLLSELEEAQAGGEAELSRLLEQRTFFANQLDTAQQRLAEVIYQRDTGRRVEHGLRWEIARLKSQIESRSQTAELWFEDWVANSVGSLEKVFRDTGVDLEGLIARASEREVAQGGPFQGIEPQAPDPGFAEVDPLAQSVRRLTALQRLTSTLPLASPLDHFHVTSGFGKRRDPFTRKWAFHSGLDLGAARGSEVLSTAPGVVVTAGPYGPYGNMVEIDHGMGISTRYGHLESVSVEVGDEIQFRQAVGIIGNTGRSTARHLHYEVRIDDEAYNPSNFLEAGRYLVDVFNYRQYGGGPGSAG
jgi:murein DD-endopeptidase MepM/ murein hydrolase activator NlpD